MESKFKIGDNVAVNFGYAGAFGACKITGVHFTINKVKYDVEIDVEYPDETLQRTTHKTRLYNIDSDFVVSRQEWLDWNHSRKSFGTEYFNEQMPLKLPNESEKVEFYAVSAMIDFANWILGEFQSKYEGHVEAEHLEYWKKKFNK